MLRTMLLAGLTAAGLGLGASTADACPRGGYYGGPGYSSGYYGGGYGAYPGYRAAGYRSAGYRGGSAISFGYSSYGGYPGYGYGRGYGGYPGYGYGRGYGYGGPGFYGPRSGFSIGFSSGRGWGW